MCLKIKLYSNFEFIEQKIFLLLAKMRKALTLYKEGQRLNSESFLLDDEEVDNDDEVDDIGDPYDYLAFLFMTLRSIMSTVPEKAQDILSDAESIEKKERKTKS